MIVRMKEGVNNLTIGAAIKAFQKKGCDVHFKRTNGHMFLVLLSSEADRMGFLEMEGIAGIDNWEKGSALFTGEDGKGWEEGHLFYPE